LKEFKCIICNSDMEYHLTKEYNEEPYNDFMKDFSKIDYYKCINCGFTFSKTHAEMDNYQWENLNKIHHNWEKKHRENLKEGKNEPTHQPPYIQQAAMINVLIKNNIIDGESILDYACGYGILQDILIKYYNTNILIHDQFITKTEKIYIMKNELRKYKTVINSAMFEHVRDRSDLDNVNNLVDKDGVFILHTVVCENIPKDSNWFYINPVHCAFHTNKSMDIIMKQWNYISSIYCPDSKCWVLFKNKLIGGGGVILKKKL